VTAVTAPDEASGVPAWRTQSSDELIRSHLPLVGHLVREVLGRVPAHVHRDDLVSAGMLALVQSAQSFDPDRGVPFGRYAALRIRGALTDELRTMDWASRAVRAKARESDAVRGELTTVLGRTPSRVEIAQALGVSARELDAVDADVSRAAVLSLQALSEAGHDLLPSVGPGPEETLLRRERLGYLRDAVAELPDRLRLVVEQWFFAQRKMTEIAEELGVSESRVSQLRSQALAQLRIGLHARDEAGNTTAADARTSARDAAYRAAVVGRSTLAGRLQATTLLGEIRAGLSAPYVRQVI
jgi:RNA polymerase sigma factor for flagellar operon FliA